MSALYLLDAYTEPKKKQQKKTKNKQLETNTLASCRGDRGKMIHFCFYDWIYLIAFKCIIHCQVLATTWDKEIQA